MTINELDYDKSGKCTGCREAYNKELRADQNHQKVESTANGGIRIILKREDEFGYGSALDIVFEPNEVQLIKLVSLLSDKLV